MHAWRKANGYIRAGKHGRAVHWLARTLKILEGGPPSSRHEGRSTTYLLIGVIILLVCWIAVKG